MTGRAALVVLAAAATLTAACGGGGAGGGAPGVSVPDGFVVEEVVTGLDHPTQLVIAPDARWIVAQLAGGERDGTGQVVAIDPADPDRVELIADDLEVPTGVALTGSGPTLWVMEARRLSAGAIGGDRQILADDLPFNGRSEGTLTPLPDGRVLHDTSGSASGAHVVAGSGSLWSVGADGAATEVATGLKHGYAHTVDGDRLWITEIGDGTYDGVTPPDELDVMTLGAGVVDFGWPRCIGDRRPVTEFGGTDEGCAATARPHALFPSHATPTSVVVAPWDPDVLLVALWNAGEIVTVPATTGDAPHAGTTFLSGIAHPQHLTVDGDGVLLVDHDGGRILAIHTVP